MNTTLLELQALREAALAQGMPIAGLHLHTDPVGLRRLADMVEESCGFYRADGRLSVDEVAKTRPLWEKGGCFHGIFSPLNGVTDPTKLLGIEMMGMIVTADPAAQTFRIVP